MVSLNLVPYIPLPYQTLSACVKHLVMHHLTNKAVGPMRLMISQNHDCHDSTVLTSTNLNHISQKCLRDMPDS